MGLRSLCFPTSICGLKEVNYFFFPRECFRKIKRTNAKITNNRCHYNINSLQPGTAAACQVATFPQRLRFPPTPENSGMKTRAVSAGSVPPPWRRMERNPPPQRPIDRDAAAGRWEPRSQQLNGQSGRRRSLFTQTSFLTISACNFPPFWLPVVT